MELKFKVSNVNATDRELLIVPYGIEIYQSHTE